MLVFLGYEGVRWVRFFPLSLLPVRWHFVDLDFWLWPVVVVDGVDGWMSLGMWADARAVLKHP